MGRILLLLALTLHFAYAQDDYYEDEPVDNYDAYGEEAPVDAQPMPLTKDELPKQIPSDMAPQPQDDYVDSYPESEPYPDDPYPVNEEPVYEDNY